MEPGPDLVWDRVRDLVGIWFGIRTQRVLRGEPPRPAGVIAVCSAASTVRAVDKDCVYSLNRLAKESGYGKAALRKLIETKRLDATRSGSGRQEWKVTQAAAVAAGLRVSGGNELNDWKAVRTIDRDDVAASTVDAALARLLELSLRPVDSRLSAIEALHEGFLVELRELRSSVESIAAELSQPAHSSRSWIVRLLRRASSRLGLG